MKQQKTWLEVLKKNEPLLLPVAHDALSALLIKQNGYSAYQIAGFAVAASQFAYPDIGLIDFGDTFQIIKNIINSSDLPVLIDAGSGYGDVKKITRIIQEYEKLGISAIFIEDQAEPIKCGHMSKKKVITIDHMINKIKAAIGARQNENTFIIARTDARDAENLDSALKRGEQYLKTGANAIYIEGLHNLKEIEKVGKIFKGNYLATSILENGGETPWIDPIEMYNLGYCMLLFPTTILFRLVNTINKTLQNLASLQAIDKSNSINLNEMEKILNLNYWKEIEKKY